MIAQYRRIKQTLPADALLLFRLGDFYEMFCEDALTGAQLLNVALTKRGLIPMCGIPHHAAGAYISRLLKAGRKVAICDQMEEARSGQLVKREVTQILSPGTHFDERMLVAERNNFLAAIHPIGQTFGLAVVDLTTGDFKTTEVHGEAALVAELERLRPAEIIYPSECKTLGSILPGQQRACSPYEDYAFAPERRRIHRSRPFQSGHARWFRPEEPPRRYRRDGRRSPLLGPALAPRSHPSHELILYERSGFLTLDIISLRNLEILAPLRSEGPRSASLYGALNRTVTPMGARRLQDWLTQPLASSGADLRTSRRGPHLIEDPAALEQFRRGLSEVRDLRGTMGRPERRDW